MQVATSNSTNINKQKNYILGEAATMAEYQEVYDTLMNRDWVIQVRRNEFQVINLARRGWKWGYDNRKRAIGGCRGRSKRITISRFFLDANLGHRAHDLEDTIRHEIAHALDHETRGYSGHDGPWKNLAEQVGAIPLAVSKDLDEGQHKWTLKCPNCGREARRHKLTQTARSGACGRCCRIYNAGRYTDKYKFEVIQNF